MPTSGLVWYAGSAMQRFSWMKPAVAASIASLLVLAVAAHPATAQATARATVYVVAGSVPRSVGSASRLLAYARSHRARQLQESTEEPMDQRHWYADVVIQFSRPLTERAFTILLYDVTDGERSLLGAPVDSVVGRDQTIIVQNIRIDRPRARPNRDVEAVVTVRRQEVGRARFRIVGEARRGNGSLDFTQTDPEARR